MFNLLLFYLLWILVWFICEPKRFIYSIGRIIKKIKYIINHKKAYLMIMKKYKPNKITVRGIFHDCDKLILCILGLIFCPTLVELEYISKLHKKISHYHFKAKTNNDFYYQIIDYECARYTKVDKPLTAREYIDFKYKNNEIDNKKYLRYCQIMDNMELY